MHEHINTTPGRLQHQSAAERIKEFGGVDLLDAGLRAIKRGRAIFPCNGKKEPLTAHGFKDATTDEQQIRAWAKRFPGAQWGYALPKEILVLDLDIKQGKNGFTDFEELQNCKPEEFSAPRVATPSGGMHLYTDPNGQEFYGTVGKIAPGIDTRTLGNYVCIPSGPQCGYRWLNNIEILPPTPEWVEATLHINSNFEAIANAQTYAGPSAFGNFMLENACDAIRSAPGGEQELTLSLKALHMGHYVGGGLLERSATIEALVLAGLQMVDYDPHYEWTAKEIRKKVERRIDAGRRQPWDDGSELDRRTQSNIDRLLNDPQYAKEVEDLLEEEDAKRPTEQATQQTAAMKQDAPKQGQQTEQPRTTAEQKVPPAEILDAGDDLELPPPREWLLGNIFCRTFLSSLFGDGGVGKTALRYAQYASLAIGRSLTGEHVFQQCRVLIISLEDNQVELRRRIWAVRHHYNIKPEELKGWLFLWAPGAKSGKLMTLDKQGNPQPGRLKAKIESLVANHNLDLVAIDPFVKSHGVGENNNNAIDLVAQVLTDLSHDYNIAVDAPHHVSKAGPKAEPEPGDANRGRGASAMKDAARLVYTLNVITKDEAKTFGISEGDRFAYIRMDKGKVNIAPPSRKAVWFHLVGVPLGNATEMYPRGDNMQVVEPWSPADMWDGVSDEQMDRILAEIDEGLSGGRRYSDAPSARARGAWQVVQKHIPGKTEQQAKEIIKTWVKNGLLETRKYENKEARKEEDGLWVVKKAVQEVIPF